MYKPDYWVLLKVGDYYKVFGSWLGGYLGSDSWRLNSGIDKVEEDEEYYHFIGFSGSVYSCAKNENVYRVSGMESKGVYSKIIEQDGVEEISWAEVEHIIKTINNKEV